MPESFYELLKPFIWPRYCEEGPPRYIDIAFLNKHFTNTDGTIKEPVRSILDLIVFGYRPITAISILATLVENQNRPMYGSQIGAQLERKFNLPKGWFTKTRYYDTRIGKLLKILERQTILEEMKVKDWRTNKEYTGYHIVANIYPAVRERILSFCNGGSLSIFGSLGQNGVKQEELEELKKCPKCNALITSQSAKYCELCSTPLAVRCPSCGKETSLEYQFCLRCGKKIE